MCVDFAHNLIYFLMADMFEDGGFGDVLPFEPVGVLSVTELPYEKHAGVSLHDGVDVPVGGSVAPASVASMSPSAGYADEADPP